MRLPFFKSRRGRSIDLLWLWLLLHPGLALGAPTQAQITGTMYKPGGSVCAGCNFTVRTPFTQVVDGGSFPGGSQSSWKTDANGALPSDAYSWQGLWVEITQAYADPCSVQIPTTSTVTLATLSSSCASPPLGGSNADINAVWMCSSGDCSALTAGGGDTLDATGADSTAPCKDGTAAPATCSVGDCFFDTDATAGENLSICTSTDTWTQISGGGGGSGDVTDVGDCTGPACFNGTSGNALQFEGSTADAYETTLTVTDPTADRTITLPNRTGTVALEKVVNLLDYANCDGTNEATAIQSAVTAACGGTLYVPAATCAFSSTITGCSNLTIKGSDGSERSGATPHRLTYNGTGTGLDFSSTASVRFEGLEIRAGSGSFSSGTLLKLDSGSYFWIDRTVFIATSGQSDTSTSKAISANNVVGLWINGGYFTRFGYHIYGRSLSSDYLTMVDIKNSVFYRAEACSLQNLGGNTTIADSWWQPQGASDTKSDIICHSSGVCQWGMAIIGSATYDQPNGPTNALFTLCGTGVSINGTQIAGNTTQDGVLYDEACDGCSITGNWFTALDEAISKTGAGANSDDYIGSNSYTTVTTQPYSSIGRDGARGTDLNDKDNIYFNFDTDASSGGSSLIIGADARGSSATQQFGFNKFYGAFFRGNDLRLYDNDNSNYGMFSWGAANIASDYTYTLPTTIGTLAVAATAPIVLNATTGNLTCTSADTSTTGCLTSTDWNTFNGKAPANAKYITQTTDATLSAEQSLGALTTGLLLNTASAGTGVLSQYAGTSCTNQFPRSLNASGAATCATVVLGTDTSGAAPTATALAADPTDCGANTYATTIAASGNLTCSAVTDAGVTDALTIAAGTIGTSDITLKQSTNPTPTAEGRIEWDTDDDLLKIGAGVGTATLAKADVSGVANSATILSTNPTDCGANTYATTIDASANLTCASITNASTTGTALSTPSTLVLRDGSSNFAAGTITAALSGNASTATALAANPADCSADTYATTIAASGALTCATVTNAGLAGSIAMSKTLLTADAGVALSTNSLTTASDEQDFLKSGALTCGAATNGKMQVHTTALQYCDNAATPTLQYAAYGTSDGKAKFLNAASCTSGVQTASDGTPSCLTAASSPEYVSRTMTAGGTVQAYGVVAADGSTADQVVEAATTVTQILGCSQSGSSVTSTNPLEVGVTGIARCSTDASVVAGSLVKLGATGQFALGTTAEKTWGRAVTNSTGASGSAYILLFDGAEGTIDHALDLWSNAPSLTSNTANVINFSPTLNITSTGTLNGYKYTPSVTLTGVSAVQGFRFAPTVTLNGGGDLSTINAINVDGNVTSSPTTASLGPVAKILNHPMTYTATSAGKSPATQVYDIFGAPTISSSATSSTATTSLVVGGTSRPTISQTGNGGALTITSLTHFQASGTINAGTGGTATITTRKGLEVNDITKNAGGGTETVTTNIGVDIAALSKGATNIGLRNAATTVLTPTTQAIAAATDTITCDTTYKQFTTATGTTTMTSNPTIADGQTGQICVLENRDGTATDCITITADTKGIQLNATAGNATICPDDTLMVVYNGTDWVEITRSKNR